MSTTVVRQVYWLKPGSEPIKIGEFENNACDIRGELRDLRDDIMQRSGGKFPSELCITFQDFKTSSGEYSYGHGYYTIEDLQVKSESIKKDFRASLLRILGYKNRAELSCKIDVLAKGLLCGSDHKDSAFDEYKKLFMSDDSAYESYRDEDFEFDLDDTIESYVSSICGFESECSSICTIASCYENANCSSNESVNVDDIVVLFYYC